MAVKERFSLYFPLSSKVYEKIIAVWIPTVLDHKIANVSKVSLDQRTSILLFVKILLSKLSAQKEVFAIFGFFSTG